MKKLVLVESDRSKILSRSVNASYVLEDFESHCRIRWHFFGGNQAAFVGSLHPFLQNAAGCWAYLYCRLVANKRINALGPSHALIVAQN